MALVPASRHSARRGVGVHVGATAHEPPLYRCAPSIPFSREAVCAALAGAPVQAPPPPLYRSPAPPQAFQPYAYQPQQQQPRHLLHHHHAATDAADTQPLLLQLDHGDAVPAPVQSGASRRGRIDVLKLLEFDCRTGTRAAGCMLLLMFVIFVCGICALLVVVVVRVDGILDTMDVRPLTAQMHGAVATAWNASTNMHVFSAELRETLAEMRVPLMESINSTEQMVANVRHFAQHPAISFSVQPGALLGGGAVAPRAGEG